MTRVAFKQCDVERALRASLRVGVAVSVRIERKTGDLLIVPAEPPGVDKSAPGAAPTPEELDAMLEAVLTGDEG